MNNGVDFAVIDRILDHHGAQASNVIAICRISRGNTGICPGKFFPTWRENYR